MPPPPVQPQAPGQQPGQGRDHGTVSPRWMILLGQPFLLKSETGAGRARAVFKSVRCSGVAG
jgi:hypothetical protein